MSGLFKKKIDFILFLFLLLAFLSSTKKVVAANPAPIPEPYVPCNKTDKPEWHSLRPYQASPCQVPIKNEEQALLCGKDFVLNQTFTTDVNSPYCHCPPPPGGCGVFPVICHCEVPKEFETSLNAFNSELPIAGNTELIPSGKTSSLGENEKRLTDWKNHLPPNPKDFSDLKKYYEAYQEWRGKTCASVTIPFIKIEIFFCFNNPLKPDFWADLFPYIPYSSTEDRIGKTSSSDFDGKPLTAFVIKDLKTEWKDKLNEERNQNTQKREGVLYFPHMEENAELSTLLQSTFVAKKNLNDKQAQSIKTEDIEPVKQNAGCTILDSRYNPGDQLFGEQIDEKAKKSTGAPASKVTYTAVFDCPAVWICFPPPDCSCVLVGKCTHTGQFTAQIDTFTPLADEIWSKTTAGNSAIFRKIMPKTGSNSPYEKIKDIPASSGVEYNPSGEGVQLITQNPQLYFAHFGGIYDYFLQGIQTALRPRGFEGAPAGLTKDQAIPEPDRANEYLSWYLNGTLYRAEGDPLSYKEKEDIKRVTTFSGPLNKLLPQEIQWRNKIKSDVLNSQRPKTQQTGRVDEVTPRAKKDRHDQIVACTKGIKIPGWIPFIGGIEIGAIPTACSEKSIASVGQNTGGTSPSPSPGNCPSIPDSQVNPKYLGNTKSNFKRMASSYGGCDLVDQCYNYVVSESEKAGVNPALTLTLWLHESGASSYCTNPGVEDFGVHTIPGEDVVGQLARWLEIASSPNSACNWCYNQHPNEWKEPMQAFLYVYRFGAGDCNPQGDQSFYNNMAKMFQWVSDPIAYCLDSNGGFAINCPTDNSCP
jgi:hypothetical protein